MTKAINEAIKATVNKQISSDNTYIATSGKAGFIRAYLNCVEKSILKNKGSVETLCPETQYHYIYKAM
jgi:hypothetical protein